MEHDRTKDRNYWHLLDDAEGALDRGDLPAAEGLFLAAEHRRDGSPGRVFLTESLGDGLRRLLRSRRPSDDPATAAGRWERRAAAFGREFLAAGERAVREGVRLAELRPEDDAETNQPVLETALFLVVRSRLFPEEFASAVPLLKGLFRTAARTAHPFDVRLIRHDVPLTEEDRLWLARRGGDLLEIFLEQGRLERGSGPAREWAAAVLQLLQPRYFGSSGRLAEERAWLEAVTADRLQGDAAASVRLYRAYLQTNPEPGPRADEARVRTLELLANVDAAHFPAPRYDEALGALQSAGLAAGSEQAGRYGTAVARIEYRRPEPEPGAASAAWATAALGGDGTVSVVFWWGAEPRDLARWTPGADTGALELFLEPCGDRIVARDVATLATVGDRWVEVPAAWPVDAFVEALAEPDLPRSGVDEAILRRLAAGERGPWRAGWRRELGLPDLRPADDWATDPRADTGLGRALLTGLAVLALRTRVGQGDPSLRAGVLALAGRGDAAAGVLHQLLTVGDEAARAMDASFAPWTVPLLWTRPDPFARPGRGVGTAETAAASHPDLGRNDVAVVTTGDPAAVLAAWGAGRSRWRVVLDRMDRLAGVAPAAADVVGPVTVIPRDGLVHRLDAALALLDDLVRTRPAPDDPVGGLLAVFHWVRVVSTHNGDLLDFHAVRPWHAGAFPLYDRYAARVAELPREEPVLAARAEDDGWGAQFGQRARKAGFVAGHVDQLPGDPARLDALWGVFEGSDASWVFLDAAAVHARLAVPGEAGLPARHDGLLQRGRRHLSLLTGAVWCREDLEDLLARWLAPYGPVYRLALTDLRTPGLLLADRGPAPGGRRLAGEALAAALAHVVEAASDGTPRLVALPRRPTARAFWRAARDGRFDVPTEGWDLLDEPGAGPPAGVDAVLAVPELASLDRQPPDPAGPHAAGWEAADEDRARRVEELVRRASLELAGLVAGGWSAVEVLDPRWWRLLRDGRPRNDDADAEPAPANWSGEPAAALAAGGRARCFDLPETSGEARRRLAPALAAEVAAWLAARGEQPPPEAAATAWPTAGARLDVGGTGPAGDALLAVVEAAWERGRLDTWILVVAPRAWDAAADVIARCGGAACSTWPARGHAPAPVLWVRPKDLLDGTVAAYAARHRPRLVLVPDLTAWLPDGGGGAQVRAAALRVVLRLEAPAILLQAPKLADPWREFLTEATGVAVDGPPDPGSAGADRSLRAATLVARLRRLLGRLRPLLEERREAAAPDRALPDLDGELLPAARLAVQAGLAPSLVEDAVRVLRWAARLAGDPLSSAGDGGPGPADGSRCHAVLVPDRFAELEGRLDRLAGTLGLFLPLWLGRTPVGGRTWIDLAQPPARAEADALPEVDTWLLGCDATAAGLDYQAPRGTLATTRRLVGLDRPLAQVQAALLAELDLFRRRVKDVMGAAVETGGGFLVDTGLEELRPDERAFLALGTAMGFWRWFGPPGDGALPLVDLLTLADSATVRSRDEAWTLVGALGGRPMPPAEDREAAAGGGRLRALFGQGGRDDDEDDAALAVARLGGEAPEPAFLVLRGLAGTGRLASVVGGLGRAAAHAADPGDVTVYCPDAAAAAAVARAVLAEGLAVDLRLTDEDDLPEPAAAPAAGAGAPGRDDVVVMVEIQRFAPEVRYRIAQHGRGRRLLMSVDPAAGIESWENLFLTTPRTSDVLVLDEQRDQARRLWEQVRNLVPEPLAGGVRSRRRERGDVVAEYAANLDQGVARILSARAEGLLPTRLRVTAPLASDLDYLATALRDHGWLAVDEESLDRLALPGPCDLLAAAADVLAATGAWRPDGRAATDATAEPNEGADEDGDAAGDATADGAASPVPGAGVLARLVPRGVPAGAWPPVPLPDPHAVTLAGLAARLLADPDAAPALAAPPARRRLEAVLAAWGSRTLDDLPADPLWQAWWTTLAGDLGLPDPAPDRPLVRLASAARTPGVPVAGGVHLCLGGEDPRQHYRILSRLTEAALVLYQDRSPLAET